MNASGIDCARCAASVSASTEPPVAITNICMPCSMATSRIRRALVKPPTRLSLMPNTSASPSRAIRVASCNVTNDSSTLIGDVVTRLISAISSKVSPGCSKVTPRSATAFMTMLASRRVHARLTSYRMISPSFLFDSICRIRSISFAVSLPPTLAEWAT